MSEMQNHLKYKFSFVGRSDALRQNPKNCTASPSFAYNRDWGLQFSSGRHCLPMQCGKLRRLWKAVWDITEGRGNLLVEERRRGKQNRSPLLIRVMEPYDHALLGMRLEAAVVLYLPNAECRGQFFAPILYNKERGTGNPLYAVGSIADWSWIKQWGAAGSSLLWLLWWWLPLGWLHGAVGGRCKNRHGSILIKQWPVFNPVSSCDFILGSRGNSLLTPVWQVGNLWHFPEL